MSGRYRWWEARRWQGLCLGVVVGLAAVAGRADAQTLDQTFEGKDHYRFVIVPKAVAPWFDSVNDGAQQAARMIEAQSGAEVEIVYSAPQQSQVAIQNQILEQAIATQPDGIAVDPLDANANRAILQGKRCTNPAVAA